MALSGSTRVSPGYRSILASVVDIEEASVLAALQEDESAVFLFDFAAALPSMSQDYFLRALEHIGLPPHVLHAVRALYDNSRCRPAFGGQLWGGSSERRGSDMDAHSRPYSLLPLWTRSCGSCSAICQAS